MGGLSELVAYGLTPCGVIASNSEAIQTQSRPQRKSLDCFASLAMTLEIV